MINRQPNRAIELSRINPATVTNLILRLGFFMLNGEKMKYHVRVEGDTVCIYQDDDPVQVDIIDAEKLIISISRAIGEIRKNYNES